MGIPTLSVQGPTSGTYTASPTANRIGVYLYAGGGGSAQNPDSSNSKSGGVGGGGFYNKPITQPFSQPYSVGGPGGNSANAGGNTTMANVGTVNGGAGAPGPSTNPAASGNQPGASLTVPLSFRTGSVNIASAPGQSNPSAVLVGPGFGSAGRFQVNGGCTGFTNLTAGTGAIIVFENTGT
jgi:hypothetical protein